MKIKIEKESPWVEVDERELARARHGPGAADLQEADLLNVSKDLRRVQDGRWKEGLGKVVMRIPADIYFQMAINKPGCWEGDDKFSTLSKVWDTYEDMRCVKGGNPWKRKKS